MIMGRYDGMKRVVVLGKTGAVRCIGSEGRRLAQMVRLDKGGRLYLVEELKRTKGDPPWPRRPCRTRDKVIERWDA